MDRRPETDGRQEEFKDARFFTAHASDIPLTGALESYFKLFTTGVALVSARSFSGFAMINGDGILDYPAGTRIPSDNEIFEVRLFNQDAELRWVGDANQLNATGAVAFISDIPFEAPAGWPDVLPPTDGFRRENQYLLWGDVRKPLVSSNWSNLFDHRLGELPIPLANLQTKKKAVVHTMEYFTTDSKWGNLAFVAERMRTVSPYEEA